MPSTPLIPGWSQLLRCESFRLAAELPEDRLGYVTSLNAESLALPFCSGVSAAVCLKRGPTSPSLHQWTSSRERQPASRTPLDSRVLRQAQQSLGVVRNASFSAIVHSQGCVRPLRGELRLSRAQASQAHAQPPQCMCEPARASPA